MKNEPDFKKEKEMIEKDFRTQSIPPPTNHKENNLHDISSV